MQCAMLYSLPCITLVMGGHVRGLVLTARLCSLVRPVGLSDTLISDDAENGSTKWMILAHASGGPEEG